MQKQGRVLIVDDNKSVLVAVKILFSGIFDQVYTLSSPKTIHSFLRDTPVDVVVLDMNFESGLNNGNEGLYWLSEIKHTMGSRVEVVLITAFADIDLAIQGMKSGACDFVVKPWDNVKLIKVVKQAFERVVSNRNMDVSKGKTVNSSGFRPSFFWGDSEPMTELREMVLKVALTDANILIVGENGTGKEVLAREIHALSERKVHPFVTVDMGAITETLFESELFGHVKGAFTDARSDREGKFEAAEGGTLFMDEIGNLPFHLQSKLLSVLQTRKVTRVGANRPIDVDIRLLSATNCDIEKMVRSGEFRMDLMYRMNTILLKIPPLRERSSDIIPLAELFVEQYGIKYRKPDLLLATVVKEKLLKHPWYGNIRELQHAVEKAVILCDSHLIRTDDLQPEEGFEMSHSSESSFSSKTTLEEMEYEMIKEAIVKCRSNISLAASMLGISRQTLYNKMKKYNF